MLIYLAIAGAVMVLFWVHDADERERLRAYAVTLGGSTALAFLIFASNDNRQAVCDALSPVWLSDVLLGGALAYVLAWLSPADWKRRLALAAAAGIVVAAFHALMWPHCLQRLEGVSPEVERLWLSHVKEARPFYMHGWRIASLIMALPATGAVGWLAAHLDAAARRPGVAAPDHRRGLAGHCGDPAPVLADAHRPGFANDGGHRLRRARLGADPAGVELALLLASGGRRGHRGRGGSGRRGAVRPELHPGGQADRRAKPRSARPTGCAHPYGGCIRWRFSPRAWCSPSSTSDRG